MKKLLTIFSLTLFSYGLASSGTDFLLNRYGEVLYEICDSSYTSSAQRLTQVDARYVYCIFYEGKPIVFFNSMLPVIENQVGKGKPFIEIDPGFSSASIEGAYIEAESYHYTNRDNTEGEILAFSRGQGTYLVIFQSY